MDGHRFDAIARVLGRGLPRRGVIKGLTAGAITGAAARARENTVVAGGNLTDYCQENSECNSPLVCINRECDHCRKSGDCKVGWCCSGYSCEGGSCIECAHGKSNGVKSEGCRGSKKDKKKKDKRH